MTNPADTKKGAVPLDANVKNGEQRSEPAQGEQAKPKDVLEQLALNMGETLGYLYNEVKAGRVKALSCVFVDDSGVPQHAFFVAPNAAVPLLAGMMVGTDSVKNGAGQTMEGYRKFLQQRAEHLAEQANQRTAAPSGSDKPN